MHTNTIIRHSLCFFFSGSGGGFPSGLWQLACCKACGLCKLQLWTCCSWWSSSAMSDGTLSYVDKCLSRRCLWRVFSGKAGGMASTDTPSEETVLAVSPCTLCSVCCEEDISDDNTSLWVCDAPTLDSAVVRCTCHILLQLDSVLMYDAALCCEERELICCEEA
jgi:hypothetical protein